jgi:hypothetical protein
VVTLNANQSDPEIVALPVNGEIQFNASDTTLSHLEPHRSVHAAHQ